jgi:hypothetical protein
MSRLKTKQYVLEDRGKIETPKGFGFDIWIKLEVEGQCDCGHTFDTIIEAPLRSKHIHVTCCMCKSNEWTIDVKII